MHALSAADILDVWEVGRAQPPVERALTLLERACPQSARDSLARLPLGTRDRLLLAAGAGTIGGALEATAGCPACGEMLEFSLPTEGLLAGDPQPEELQPGDSPPSQEHEADLAGHRLRFRLLDSTDLLAAAACPDAESARSALVERCVLEARRDEVEVAVGDLPSQVVAALAERLIDLDPQAETLIDLTCPACSEAWRTELDLADFVWAEIRARALRLLDEVDALARAYGWSEAEILALGRARRRSYMERVI